MIGNWGVPKNGVVGTVSTRESPGRLIRYSAYPPVKGVDLCVHLEEQLQNWMLFDLLSTLACFELIDSALNVDTGRVLPHCLPHGVEPIQFNSKSDQQANIH